VNAEQELCHLRGELDDEPPPAGFELDELSYPGGEAELARAREVMTAVLADEPLPEWFVVQCLDDSVVLTCELERWSLRAWKFWLAPENRRWWWWSAALGDGQVKVRVLVRARPFLKGSLDWLLAAARSV
jgi:hypothetical protein